jgi:4-amino-4-deoxy-L-arabinose transferase-like glycosyltransferase
MFAYDSGRLDRWRWPIALSLLGFISFMVRWYYVSTAIVVQPVRGDAIQYVSYAWNLLTHHTFSKTLPGSASLTPDSYRDPGYPFFLALLMKAFGTGDAWYAAVLLGQALLGSLTVVLTTHLGKCWLIARWAFAAGMLMAVWPHSVTINGVLLSETLVSFLCAAGLLSFVNAFRCQSRSWALASGVMLGAAALTNAALLPFGALLAALLAWRRLANRQLCLALVVGALLLPGCWALRASQLPPSAFGDSSRDRALQNFAQGASPDFHRAYRDSLFGDAAQQRSAAVTLRAVDASYALLKKSPLEGLRYLWRNMKEHPFRYASWYLIEKPHELWGWDIVIGQGDIYVYPTVNSPFQNQHIWIALEVFCQSINMLIMLLCASGMLGLVLSSNFRHLASPGLAGEAALIATAYLLAFITVVYCILQEEPRYAVAYRPFEIVMAFTTIAFVSRYRQKLRRSTPNAG